MEAGHRVCPQSAGGPAQESGSRGSDLSRAAAAMAAVGGSRLGLRFRGRAQDLIADDALRTSRLRHVRTIEATVPPSTRLMPWNLRRLLPLGGSRQRCWRARPMLPASLAGAARPAAGHRSRARPAAVPGRAHPGSSGGGRRCPSSPATAREATGGSMKCRSRRCRIAACICRNSWPARWSSEGDP